MTAANDDSRRVLVGVDRSLSARVALAHAARRAGARGFLIVAHVLPPLPTGLLGPRALAEFQRESRVAGQQLVDRLAGDAGVANSARSAPALLGSVSVGLVAAAGRPVALVPASAGDAPAG